MPNQQPSLDLMFQALADPARRSMVERLSRGPASVSELARPLDMSLPAVMQHLAMLEAGGIVASEKVGRVRTCRINPDVLSLAEQWINQRRTQWERRLDRLGDFLAAEDEETRNDRPPNHARNVIHATFTVERVYAASPARVFAAFADPEKKKQWFKPPEEWGPPDQTFDFRVGGEEHSIGGPPGDPPHRFYNRYLEIIPMSGSSTPTGCITASRWPRPRSRRWSSGPRVTRRA
jgi:DNA-binding transcriptional ArsR family regulator